MPEQTPRALCEKPVLHLEFVTSILQNKVTGWYYLKAGQLDGRKFRRQHSVGPHVLDFYCPEEKLAVELDGESHAGPIAAARDAKRTAYLQAQGIEVLRFENRVVWEMPEALLERIRKHFRDE